MKIVSALLLLVVGCGQEHTGDPIVVRDAWIREPPPRSPAAGYLVIENRGGEPVALVAVATEAAEQTEIHVMEYKDDRMTMRRVSELQVPAGEEIALKPGGTHLMLMELRQTAAGRRRGGAGAALWRWNGKAHTNAGAEERAL